MRWCQPVSASSAAPVRQGPPSGIHLAWIYWLVLQEDQLLACISELAVVTQCDAGWAGEGRHGAATATAARPPPVGDAPGGTRSQPATHPTRPPTRAPAHPQGHHPRPHPPAAPQMWQTAPPWEGGLGKRLGGAGGKRRAAGRGEASKTGTKKGGGSKRRAAAQAVPTHATSAESYSAVTPMQAAVQNFYDYALSLGARRSSSPKWSLGSTGRPSNCSPGSACCPSNSMLCRRQRRSFTNTLSSRR